MLHIGTETHTSMIKWFKDYYKKNKKLVDIIINIKSINDENIICQQVPTLSNLLLNNKEFEDYYAIKGYEHINFMHLHSTIEIKEVEFSNYKGKYYKTMGISVGRIVCGTYEIKYKNDNKNKYFISKNDLERLIEGFRYLYNAIQNTEENKKINYLFSLIENSEIREDKLEKSRNKWKKECISLRNKLKKMENK